MVLGIGYVSPNEFEARKLQKVNISLTVCREDPTLPYALLDENYESRLSELTHNFSEWASYSN